MNTSSPAYALPPLTNGRILKRYKRFLADVELDTGELVTAHCANTGSMTGCWKPGAPVQLSHSDNPKRKLAWTLERVDMGAGWIGVNTARTNHIVCALINARLIPGLEAFDDIKREPAYSPVGYDRSRFDLLLTAADRADCFIEVKNTTLVVGNQVQFPDAVTSRGRKHLTLLAHAVEEGHRGVMLFAVNRPEGDSFSPARQIDPGYAETLDQVRASGVEAMAVRLAHTATGVNFGGLVEIDPPRPAGPLRTTPSSP